MIDSDPLFTEDMKAFIEAQVSRQGHASADEYLRSLVREAQKKAARQELAAKLAEGLQGTPVPMTRGDWDSIRREAIDGLAGEPIRP